MNTHLHTPTHVLGGKRSVSILAQGSRKNGALLIFTRARQVEMVIGIQHYIHVVCPCLSWGTHSASRRLFEAAAASKAVKLAAGLGTVGGGVAAHKVHRQTGSIGQGAVAGGALLFALEMLVMLVLAAFTVYNAGGWEQFLGSPGEEAVMLDSGCDVSSVDSETIELPQQATMLAGGQTYNLC